jgi:putative ABC transport system permease protein
LEVIGIIPPDDEQDQGSSGMQFTMMGRRSVGDTISIPYETMDLLWEPADDVIMTLVRTEPGWDVDSVADRAETALKGQGSEIRAVTFNDISQAIGSVMSIVSAFLAGIAGISLLVGGVGVMNTMFTSVLERTKEIGVMKAVGAKNSHVRSIFLIESGLMGLVGGVVGTLLGLGVSALASIFVSKLFGLGVIIVASPAVIAATLFGSFALGALAGLWPAWRASRLPVVEALRYE